MAKDLEAAGVKRVEAEAYVQAWLEFMEGDLMTKSDFSTFKEHLDKRFGHIDKRFGEVDRRFDQINFKFEQVNHQFRETELRLIIKNGLMMATMLTILGGVLGWLIQVK